MSCALFCTAVKMKDLEGRFVRDCARFGALRAEA
jgi:hypothetical protein